MSDPRYNNSYNEVTATFAVRTFKNLMPMIMEVLEKMKKEFYVEKSVCLSHGNSRLTSGPVDLFRFVTQVTDLYKFCPQPVVINSMLSLAYK